MRLDDGYEWPTYFNVHGRYPRTTDPFPVEIRCGLLAPSGESDERLLAIGIADEEPVVITVPVASELREKLADASSEYTTMARAAEAKQVEAAQRLLGNAGVVLSQDKWRATLDALASDDPAQRERVLDTLTSNRPETNSQ